MKSLKSEVIGGVTTFLTMSYIIAVNPAILSTPGTGMSFSGVMTATVLLSFLMTLLMGLYAKLPFAVAPGMGINAFFTFTIILGQQVPWQTALGMVFWSGVLFVIASMTSARTALAEAIPTHLRLAAATGIGLFLTFIGLKNAGFVVADPVTYLTVGKLTSQTALSMGGLVVMLLLLRLRNPFAFIAGIAGVTIAALILGLAHPPQQLFSAPDFESVFLKADIWGALKLSLLPAILAIFLTDLFDSLSTFMGVSHAAGLLDQNGKPLRLKQGLMVDALATLFASGFGTSSGTAYIESAAGIEAGARTGRASIVTALCFLPCLFIAPILAVIPPYASAPVLVLVGAMMFKSVSGLKFEKIEEGIPAFLTLILIPLTFSITQGILWGFIAHVGLFTISGRRKEIHPMMWAVSILALLLIAVEFGIQRTS